MKKLLTLVLALVAFSTTYVEAKSTQNGVQKEKTVAGSGTQG